MHVRLGFVANALRLKDCSPSKTVTVSNINKIPEKSDQIGRLIRVATLNLQNTLRILKANVFDRIFVYRMTSKLIPLCTHPQFSDWPFYQDLQDGLRQIGDFVREEKLRVSLHPDHFTLLNSPKPEVQEASWRDLQYHHQVLEAMGLNSEAKLVLHVGGKYDDPRAALQRFKKQFDALPKAIKLRLAIENDDRCFTAITVLTLCQEIGAPMVFDLHHHHILNSEETVAELLPDIFATWGNLLPKVHISSPKNDREPRNHADFINCKTAAGFLEQASQIGRDFDLMIEAKQKDLALLRLADELRELGYKLPTNGEIIL